MPAFNFTALDSNGKRQQGLIEADSERHASRLLRERGWHPLALESGEPRGAELTDASRWRYRRVPASQVTLFTRLLGTLLQSGLPLDDAMTAIAGQSEHPQLKRTVIELRARILEGNSLATALAQFPRDFSDVYRATVGAGEQTRHLPLVLMRLADHEDERNALAQKIKLALIYPAVLTVVAILVVAGLLTFVVPEVVKVFEHSKRELPALTIALIATSRFMVAHGAWLALALLALIIGVARALQRPQVRRARDRALLSLPGVRRFITESDAARFARTMSILLGSGLNMLTALQIASKSIVSIPIREQVEHAITRVREGSSLSGALSQCSYVPRLLTHLAANGEASGELPRMLDTAAQSHEREVALRLSLGLNLLEPMLILTMGALVLTIVLAILLPIFDMNQLV